MDYDIQRENAWVRAEGKEEKVDIYAGTVEQAKELVKELAIAKLKGEWE